MWSPTNVYFIYKINKIIYDYLYKPKQFNLFVRETNCVIKKSARLSLTPEVISLYIFIT